MALVPCKADLGKACSPQGSKMFNHLVKWRRRGRYSHSANNILNLLYINSHYFVKYHEIYHADVFLMNQILQADLGDRAFISI